MFKSGLIASTGRIATLVLVLVAGILSGCQSKQEQALDQAKKQAAATGQSQQVVSVDKSGTTTTTIVQPPEKGQANGAITTTSFPISPAIVTAELAISLVLIFMKVSRPAYFL